MIDTDASAYAIGAALLQQQDEDDPTSWATVGYWSKTLISFLVSPDYGSYDPCVPPSATRQRHHTMSSSKRPLDSSHDDPSPKRPCHYSILLLHPFAVEEHLQTYLSALRTFMNDKTAMFRFETQLHSWSGPLSPLPRIFTMCSLSCQQALARPFQSYCSSIWKVQMPPLSYS